MSLPIVISMRRSLCCRRLPSSQPTKPMRLVRQHTLPEPKQRWRTLGLQASPVPRLNRLMGDLAVT